MAKVTVYDTEGGGPVRDVEIPDEVLAAAVKVEAWLKTMPDTMVLHGLQLAEE